jgi:hypothetical protein
MTCIVGIADKGRVWIGGDSASADDYWNLTLRDDAKVFRRDDYVLGFTTSYRMGQLLKHAAEFPAFPSDADAERFMVTTFVNSVRDCLKAGGYAKKDCEVESGGQFLVGHGAHLFQVDSDYQVIRPALGFAAVGCGAQVAMGALHACGDLAPRERILKALRAAEALNIGVRGPFVVEATGDED